MSAMPSRVLDRLDAETRGLHKISDIRWWTLSATASVDRYRKHLIDVYGFEAAVEAAIAYTPGFASVVDRRPDARSGLVATDLLTLGLSPHQIANLAQSPIAPFAGPASALGWWYVVERSTRTFTEWHDRLATQLPACAAFAYLTTPRRNATEHWEQLGRLLDRVVKTLEIETDVIAATSEALAAERTWYRRARL